MNPISNSLKYIHIVLSYEDEDILLNRLITSKSTFILSFVNSHALNLCYRDELFHQSLFKYSDLILRDGIGMKLFFLLFSCDPGFNMNGTDLIPKILNIYKGKKIAIIGTLDPYLSFAYNKLKNDGHNISFFLDGFQNDFDYLNALNIHKPELLILGMGMPRQEFLSAFLKEHISFPLVIVNGGAIIDFLGDKIKRAPLWMRTFGLEWFFRLINEPARLFRRYIFGNFIFIFRILFYKIKQLFQFYF